MGKRSLLLACEVGMTSDQVCYERGADISLRSYLNRSLEILDKRMIWLSWMLTFKRSNHVSVVQQLYR